MCNPPNHKLNCGTGCLSPGGLHHQPHTELYISSPCEPTSLGLTLNRQSGFLFSHCDFQFFLFCHFLTHTNWRTSLLGPLLPTKRDSTRSVLFRSLNISLYLSPKQLMPASPEPPQLRGPMGGNLLVTLESK